jgi:hypothetical protein
MLMLYAYEDVVDKIELDKIAWVASSKSVRRKSFWDFLRFTMLMFFSLCVCVSVCVCIYKAVMAMESLYRCSLCY